MLFRPTSPLTRRGVLAGGLTLGIALALGRNPVRAAAEATGAFDAPAAPNAFVRLSADDRVTVLIKHLEMGQGVSTGLATLVADELDADWAQMDWAPAPSDASLYANLAWGPVQGTGGSTAMANAFTQMRKAGAAMRAMLVTAAAVEWAVPETEITIEHGRIRHAGSGRESGFGAFAAAASALPVPAAPRLKTPDAWIYIGKHVPRIDAPAKIRAVGPFAGDVSPEARPSVAVVARPPRFGARLASLDAAAARSVPGVTDVVEISTGVAVVARDTWSALKGRDALALSWDDTRAETRSTAELIAEARALLDRPGTVAASSGDAARALAGASTVVEVEHVYPYLAHAPMEPTNGLVYRDAHETWHGVGAFQIPTIDHAALAATLGVRQSGVVLDTTAAGGSFGRRAVPGGADWILEAAEIARAQGTGTPVRLFRTREDDMAAGYYRPLVVHRLRAGLDDQGRIVGWEHRIAGKSILKGTPFEALIMVDGVDATSVEGARVLPYAVPAHRLEVHDTREQVPVLWWRSVGHTHTAHAIETLIDELADAAGQDPVAFRMGLLGAGSREAAVLTLAAEKAGWTGPAGGNGRGRGVSVHTSFGTAVAMVADVRVEGETIRVEKIVCAVDCGIPINPDVIRAQVEGSVGFGLASVLREAMTLEGGVPQETNFDRYLPTRMSDMPAVEVHIVASETPPSGIGEPAVPTLAPAIANAVFAATGRRVRSLPLDLSRSEGA